MVVHVATGELSQFSVDAIINPTNTHGIMEGRFSQGLKELGGEEIEREILSYAPIAVGAAVITTAGTLNAKAVIHVPIMEEPGGKTGVENIRKATRAGLLAALRNEYATVAMPAIGAGKLGVPLDEAARAMVDEMRVHKQPFPQTVYWVAWRPEVAAAFEEALRFATQG